MTSPNRRLAAVLALLLALSSCGYRLSGYGASVLPETVSVVAVA